MKKKGFTLLELLITIGIISILSGITIVAINPSRQFAQANDAVRMSDVNNIVSAIAQYTTKHRGALPTGDDTIVQLDNNYRFIESDAGGSGTGINLCNDLIGEDFLNAFPIDPSLTGQTFIDCANPYRTGYQIKVENGRVSVHAPYAEEEADITITR